MYEFCHRCQGELPGYAASRRPYTDRGAPAPLADVVLFCPHCGAPQILLPEHMRAEGDELRDSTGALPPPHPEAAHATARPIDWRVALPTAAVVGLVGAVLAVGALKLDALALLSGFWVIGSGGLAVALYLRQKPKAPTSSRAGWRIGLATGLLLVVAKSAALATTGVVSRFVLHDMAGFDAENDKATRDNEDRVLAWMKDSAPGSAEQNKEVTARYESLMASPEVRAGSALAGFAVEGGFILLLAAGSGAFAGMLRARSNLLTERK